MFSSYESQGLRDQRLWGLWTIQPDGRYWQPLVSAFKDPSAFHFATQLSNDDVVVEDYYNLNNFGLGALYRFPLNPAGASSSSCARADSAERGDCPAAQDIDLRAAVQAAGSACPPDSLRSILQTST